MPRRGTWNARIVGLAPGKHGANRTGRPFTGDYAGDLLYATLAKFGLSEGVYDQHRDDGLTLTGAIILNAVKCLPPANKPEPIEIATCRPFLEESLNQLPTVRVVIALGQIAPTPRPRPRLKTRRDQFAHAASMSRRMGASYSQATTAAATTRTRGARRTMFEAGCSGDGVRPWLTKFARAVVLRRAQIRRSCGVQCIMRTRARALVNSATR